MELAPTELELEFEDEDCSLADTKDVAAKIRVVEANKAKRSVASV